MNAPAVFPTHSRSRGAHAADTPPGHAPAAPHSLIAAPCTPSPVLEELRSLLAERFQHALPAAQPPPAPVPLPTGLPAWDAQTGGIRPGEITEICGGLAATHLVLEGVLESFFRAGWLGAWVDAGNSLDVDAWCPHHLQRLLWVRCRSALMAVKAADLLLRDGNCSWVLLDLQGMAPASLRGLCGTHWHRFHRLLARQGGSLLVLSRSPLVEGVRVRIRADENWTLDALERPRLALRAQAPVHVFVRGRIPQSRGYDTPPPSGHLPHPGTQLKTA